jgi:hypothetical protein
MPSIFDRRWSLTLDGSLFFAESEDSLRCAFDILHEFGNVITYGNFQFYNLSETTITSAFKKGALFEFKAGYKENTGQIFIGTIVNVYSIRKEANVITHVLCSSGNKSKQKHVVQPKRFKKGTSVVEVIKYIVQQLGYGLQIKEDDFANDVTFVTGYTVHQDGFDVLEQLGTSYNFLWAVSMNVIYIIKHNSFLNNEVLEVNQNTGMEDRPQYTESGYTVKVRLNPQFYIGGRINIKSQYQDYKLGAMNLAEIPDRIGDGVYVVSKIHHIGDTHTDAWSSKLEGFTL